MQKHFSFIIKKIQQRISYIQYFVTVNINRVKYVFIIYFKYIIYMVCRLYLQDKNKIIKENYQNYQSNKIAIKSSVSSKRKVILEKSRFSMFLQASRHPVC